MPDIIVRPTYGTVHHIGDSIMRYKNTEIFYDFFLFLFPLCFFYLLYFIFQTLYEFAGSHWMITNFQALEIWLLKMPWRHFLHAIPAILKSTFLEALGNFLLIKYLLKCSTKCIQENANEEHTFLVKQDWIKFIEFYLFIR